MQRDVSIETSSADGGPARRAVLSVSLILVAVLGSITGVIAMPKVFRAIPSDRSRVRVILDALHSTSEPKIVVFGDSVTMGGIDGHLVSAKLTGHPLVWNLSSGAQSPAESYLYYSELPESVRTIVQIVSPQTLEIESSFSADVFNAFYMNGYRPSAPIVEGLRAAYGREIDGIMSVSPLAQGLAARWSIRQALDTEARRRLRPDLTLDRATNDLYFPAAYTTRLPSDKLAANLAPYYRPRGEAGLRISPQIQRLLLEMAGFAAESGRQFLLVFPPLNPVLQRYLGDSFMSALSTFADDHPLMRGVEVLDASRLLPDEASFVDSLHFLPEAANIFSESVAAKLW